MNWYSINVNVIYTTKQWNKMTALYFASKRMMCVVQYCYLISSYILIKYILMKWYLKKLCIPTFMVPSIKSVMCLVITNSESFFRESKGIHNWFIHGAQTSMQRKSVVADLYKVLKILMNQIVFCCGTIYVLNISLVSYDEARSLSSKVVEGRLQFFNIRFI